MNSGLYFYRCRGKRIYTNSLLNIQAFTSVSTYRGPFSGIVTLINVSLQSPNEITLSDLFTITQILDIEIQRSRGHLFCCVSGKVGESRAHASASGRVKSAVCRQPFQLRLNQRTHSATTHSKTGSDTHTPIEHYLYAHFAKRKHQSHHFPRWNPAVFNNSARKGWTMHTFWHPHVANHSMKWSLNSLPERVIKINWSNSRKVWGYGVCKADWVHWRITLCLNLIISLP